MKILITNYVYPLPSLQAGTRGHLVLPDKRGELYPA